MFVEDTRYTVYKHSLLYTRNICWPVNTSKHLLASKHGQVVFPVFLTDVLPQLWAHLPSLPECKHLHNSWPPPCHRVNVTLFAERRVAGPVAGSPQCPPCLVSVFAPCCLLRLSRGAFCFVSVWEVGADVMSLWCWTVSRTSPASLAAPCRC